MCAESGPDGLLVRRNKEADLVSCLQPITERTSVGPPSVVKAASALSTPSLGRLLWMLRGFHHASDPKSQAPTVRKSAVVLPGLSDNLQGPSFSQ